MLKAAAENRPIDQRDAGNPYINFSQDEFIRTKPRDKEPPLPKDFGRTDPKTPKEWAATALPSPPLPVVATAIKKEIDEAMDDLRYSKAAQDWAQRAQQDGFRTLEGFTPSFSIKGLGN